MEFKQNIALLLGGQRDAFLVDCPSGNIPDGHGLCQLELCGHNTFVVHTERLRARLSQLAAELQCLSSAPIAIYVGDKLRVPQLSSGATDVEQVERCSRLRETLDALVNLLSGSPRPERHIAFDCPRVCPVSLCGVILGYPVVYDVCGPYFARSRTEELFPGGNNLSGVALSVYRLRAGQVTVAFSLPMALCNDVKVHSRLQGWVDWAMQTASDVNNGQTTLGRVPAAVSTERDVVLGHVAL